MLKLAALLLVVFAAEAYGQQGATFLSLSSSLTTTSGNTCTKQIDCRPNQICQMYDYYNYPAIWPPCPHLGYCVCNQGYVQVSNGSCVPYVNLNLYDRCSGQIWEVIRTPEQRCDGAKVICNSPTYVDRTGYCQPAPVPTIITVPVIRPNVIVTVQCPLVSWLASPCDSTKACCDASRGLTCQNRGNGAAYSQCLCANDVYIFDQQLGYCRPRVYGDLCTENKDCGSGLISNSGYECRYGRCRCQLGFEPVDNLYWNETSRTTFMRRICVSSGAVTWAPTGTSCTINPEQFASSNSTRVCHPRAFCHLCYGQRGAGSSFLTTTTTALSGICREFTCSQNGECGFQGSCNRWGSMVDPPCERGMCDCSWGTGFWKDRFSRCAPMRQLWLGDRCIASPNGLHSWYINNENWEDDKYCATDPNEVGGYAGYTWGFIKCKLPLIEDQDGNCIRNDDMRGILYNVVGFNQACDESDLRLPRTICDISKGLVCRNRVCQCAASTSCSSSYAGCSATASTTTLFWDGNTCRVRGYGDQCQASTDCCGGQCIMGICSCPVGTVALDIGTAHINNGNDPAQTGITSVKYCFRNYTIVGKSQECHLDPASWNCGNLRYGWNQNNYIPALVCEPGLACLRCPADYNTDDETHGVCRSVTPVNVPVGSCGQSELVDTTFRRQSGSLNGGRWNGWSRGNAASHVSFDGSLLAAVIMTAIVRFF